MINQSFIRLTFTCNSRRLYRINQTRTVTNLNQQLQLTFPTFHTISVSRLYYTRGFLRTGGGHLVNNLLTTYIIAFYLQHESVPE